MVKASRRAIFQRFVSRRRFELGYWTANEILTRVHRLLDPEPLTDRLWESYLAVRRELHYAALDHVAGVGAGDVIDLTALAASPAYQALSAELASDFEFLLRIEAVMEPWALSPTSKGADAVADEIRRRLGPCDESELMLQHDIIDPVVRCLAKAASIPGWTR